MDKLKMQTANKADENFRKLAAMFPNAVTETIDENGEVVRAIDKDVLMQEISVKVVDGKEERYQFTWPDKKKSVLLANAPISKTLRPCREESVDFDKTQNLYIEGDNLEVLKLIQETYLNEVDVIYIDPPYNTGNDILYKNNYEISQDEYFEQYETDENGNQIFANTDSNGRFHTDWLNMMYQRLKIAKNILRDTGFILIAIDHNELFNLGEICDEIFGYCNRIGVISVIHKPEGRNQAKFIGPSNEFMLIYAKDATVAKLQNVVLDPEISKKYNLSDEKGRYRLQNFIRMTDGKLAYRNVRPNFWYPIYVDREKGLLSTTKKSAKMVEVFPITKTDVEMSWKVLPRTAQDLIDSGELEFTIDGDGFITIVEKIRETQVIKTHWIRKEYNAIQYGTKIVNELLEANIFDFPKSVFLVEDALKLCCPKDGVILDFFSGSATTAHATMLANAEDGGNRKYILVQIPASCDKKSPAFKAGYKTICEIGEQRIRRAGIKIKEENPLGTTKLDTGFRVLKCDTSNMKEIYYRPDEVEQTLFDNYANNIKEDRTPEDLLFQVMLDLGVFLSSKISEEVIGGCKVFNVAEGFLYACFDNNISDAVVTAIAKQKPYYAVFRDSGMASDSVLTNFDQIFASISPSTVRKVL